ncbi:MAG: DEAD/DEAH box helicase [Candidatus Diapherotrites archaeon]|nr:DEAD/DEAH box helicase [Candidatus Diapherotrites archaeon]
MMHDIPLIVKEANGFDQFNPMQSAVLAAPWQKQSLLVASPTASGKTIIAELTGLESILNKRKKAMYTCPLRALASEHHADLKKKYAQKLDIKMAVSTGEMDSSSKYLSNYDFIFTTYEKLDSLLVHQADWLQQLGVLIIDEIHELDSDRGPTLEMVITKLRMINPSLQIIGLSATIPNADEVAAWLKAELVQSNYRPVPLKEGVHYDGTIFFKGDEKKSLSKEDPLEGIIGDTLAQRKQSLVFANTRARAESLAKQTGGLVAPSLSLVEKKSLDRVAVRIENALESPTAQCQKLASFVRSGVAFHHAGLVQRQRELIEEHFRGGLIKTICATPTLAAGVNTPAFRVIITSLHRYDFNGLNPIPIREYRQMSGRAGRPKYDAAGESIVLCKSEADAEEVMTRYILGEMEPIQSRLGREPVLRMHLLALIASRYVSDTPTLDNFFSRTLYAHQFRQMDMLQRMLQGLVKELYELGFIDGEENRFWATPLGKRVAELYLDPLSANAVIQKLQRKDLDIFGALYTMVDTTELRPYVNVSRKNEAALWEQFQSRTDEIPLDGEEALFTDMQLLEKFQTTKFFEAWINEMGDQEILDEFRLQPGIIRTKLRNADWVMYAMVELAPLVKAQGHVKMLSKLRKRLLSGIKEELILLCELRGIGRVRARRLHNAGITNVSDVKNARAEDLAKIIGPAPALGVKKQLGDTIQKGTQKTIESAMREQKTLFD